MHQDIDAAAWDSLVSEGSAPLSTSFLAACKGMELPGYKLIPLVVKDTDHQNQAQAPGYVYEFDLGLFLNGWSARMLALARRAWPKLLVQRVFEIGCPTALCEPFCFKDGLNEEEAVESLVRRGLAQAERESVALCVVRDIKPNRTPIIQALKKLGFRPTPMPCTFEFHVTHARFDDYIASMRARYRRRALSCFKESSTLNPELLTEFEGLSPELARLWRNVYDRAKELKREVLPEAYFQAMSHVPGMRVLLLRCHNDSIAAFALLLSDGALLHFLYCGLEYDCVYQDSAYFRLLYEIIRLGIDEKFERIDFGITTAESKLAVGAKPVQLEAWIHHNDKTTLRVITYLMRSLLAPKTSYPPMHIFRLNDGLSQPRKSISKIKLD